MPRYRGDPLSESRTHADGVIGHFIIGKEGKSDLVLSPDATHFIVLEAKISSPLSSGTRNAPYYDQAARNVACMTETLRLSNRSPAEMSDLAFYVLAPEERILAGAYDKEIDPRSIRAKVERRVSDYGGKRDAWYSDWFEPAIEHMEIGVISWEEILTRLGKEDKRASDSIYDYYALCLEFN